MQFDPTIHTKEFLLSNTDVAFYLAQKSAEFAISTIGNIHEILIMEDKYGNTIAHYFAKEHSAWLLTESSKKPSVLNISSSDGTKVVHFLAMYQSAWLYTAESKSQNILEIKDGWGRSVAHYLAKYSSSWIYLESSKDKNILSLEDKDGCTVAHWLATYQSNWIYSESARDLNILTMTGNYYCSVAYILVENNKECINHDVLFDKNVLLGKNFGIALAERLSILYGRFNGMGILSIASRLIEQGAAYVSSSVIRSSIGDSLLLQGKNIIEDSLEPLVALKQLQAIYSTLAHNVNKIISTQEQKTLQKWQGLLLQSENMIRQHVDKHPELLDIEHTIDIFCEPGDDLIKRIQAERNLNLTSLDELDTSKDTGLTAVAKGIY